MHIFLQLLLAFLGSALLVFLITKARKNSTRKSGQLPGPPGLPIIGNLHQCVSSSPHIYFYELSKTYGPLISLKLGFVPTLIVSSSKIAKQVLKTHDVIFSGRHKFANQHKLSYNGLSITVAPYGDYWRAIRKVCVVHLLSSKMVQSFSSVREEEVYEMMQKISSLCDGYKPVNLSEMMTCLTNILICRIAFGRWEDGEDDAVNRSKIGVMLREIQEKAVSFCVSDYFPFMGWVNKLWGLSCDKVFLELDGLLEDIIDHHMKTNRPKVGMENIVDVLIRLQKENSFGFEITRLHIKAILMDIFVAGTDTSSATIIWGMTELMKNPKAMKQVQEETRTLMGYNTKRIIKEEDLGKLTYLKAVVKETMRMHPVAPLLVPHKATQSCVIEGYEIQEKTLVYVNAWAIGRDPEAWENPEEFRPERFLCDEPVDFRGQDFDLIPFGSGRRICPGMHLGVAMVELVLANLNYLFDWEVPFGMEKDVNDMNYLPGITTHKKIPLRLVAKNVGC